jgi:hypothetical protein
MLSIHIIQSGPQYVIHDGSFGDEEGVVVSLKARGCRQGNHALGSRGTVRHP